MIPRMIAGQLVPITAYIVMAISLNLVVGIAGDLSLGHAGFMSVGAYAGIVTAVALESAVPVRPDAPDYRHCGRRYRPSPSWAS